MNCTSSETADWETPLAPVQNEVPDISPEKEGGLGDVASTAVAPTSPSIQMLVVVPSGKTPAIDGILSPNEWLATVIVF